MTTSRRRYLATVGAGVAVAGCLGGGNDTGTSTYDCEDTTPRAAVSELPSPTMGPDEAPVTVRAWEDFACPHCKEFSLDVLPKLEAEYVESGDVQYEHHDFPIPVNERWSWGGAEAARAVQHAHGDATFFAYADLLFENQQELSMQVVADLATDVGAEPCTVQVAVENDTYRGVVEADRGAGKDAGVTGTPGVFVDDEYLDGYDWETVRDAVEQRL